MVTHFSGDISSMAGIQVRPTGRLSLAWPGVPEFWDSGRDAHLPRGIHELLAAGGIHTQGQLWGPFQVLSMLEVGQGTERCHPLV